MYVTKLYLNMRDHSI